MVREVGQESLNGEIEVHHLQERPRNHSFLEKALNSNIERDAQGTSTIREFEGREEQSTKRIGEREGGREEKV